MRAERRFLLGDCDAERGKDQRSTDVLVTIPCADDGLYAAGKSASILSTIAIVLLGRFSHQDQAGD